MPTVVCYRLLDGALISFGSQSRGAALDTATEAEAIFDRAVELRAEMWDPATTTLVPRPAPALADRIQDFLDEPGVLTAFNSLNATQRQNVRNALVKILGTRRWRRTLASKEL